MWRVKGGEGGAGLEGEGQRGGKESGRRYLKCCDVFCAEHETSGHSVLNAFWNHLLDLFGGLPPKDWPSRYRRDFTLAPVDDEDPVILSLPLKGVGRVHGAHEPVQACTQSHAGSSVVNAFGTATTGLERNQANCCRKGVWIRKAKRNHLEERLLDQAQARASYTPLLGGLLGVNRVAYPKA